MTAFDEQVLATIEPLRNAGFALHWLHPKTKRPIGDDWSTKPVATLDTLRRRHAPGNNLGVRLGEVSKLTIGLYLHVLDIDIRDDSLADEAILKLAAMFPGIDFGAFPVVRSGSGGKSRHVYFLCERHFRSKDLAKSATFKMVFDDKLGREVKKRDWEISLFGSGKQVVLPPSIHPDTGLPYSWEREFDLGMLSLGVGPSIPAARLNALGAMDCEVEDSLEIKPPLGLTPEEAESILDDLPLEEYCEDRDGWVQVGMALHHEFGGGEEGYALWSEFSQQSAKFDDKNQRTVWNSFRNKPNSVRMATLRSVAQQARLLNAFDEVDVDDDSGGDGFDDIIGTPAAEGDEFDAIIGSATAPALGWMSLLQVTKDGEGWASNLHNLELIVKNDPRLAGIAQINEFTQEVVQRLTPGKQSPRRKNQAKPVKQLEGRVWHVEDELNGELWSEDRDFAIRSVIEAPQTQGGYGIKVTDRDLRAAIALSAQDSAFHPVREYLNGLTWDETPRVETLFIDYLGAEATSYSQSIARLMMLGAVTRIFEPGHKFDFAVILEGLQGKRKSTFIETLGRRWSAELDGDFHDPKMMVELMQGAWILELPELTGFQRSDVRAIKAFISRKKDRVRMAYARRAGQYPRQCIFMGSTNDREYLKDDTGGRRFWPMPCYVAEIDTDRLEANVDQLWAEATAMYRQLRAEQPRGTLPLYLRDDEAKEIAARLQESRRQENSDDGLAGVIGAWLDQPVNEGGFEEVTEDGQPTYRDRVCLPEIWVDCLRGDVKNYTATQAQALGRAMAKGVIAADWQPQGTHRHPIYGKQRCYRRVTPLETPAGPDEFAVIG